MKGKKLIILAGLALIVWLGIYISKDLLFGRKFSTNDFVIENTSDINKIVIQDSKDTLVISKQGQKWIMNSMYSVYEGAVENLFKVAQRIRIQTPASEKTNIAAAKSENLKKVLFYKDRKLLSCYFVYKLDNLNSVMALDKPKQFFYMYLPGFEGDVTELFSFRENYWRDKTLFSVLPSQIESLSIQYPNDPNASFKLIQNQDGFQMKLYNEEVVEELNRDALAQFFTYCAYSRFENIIDTLHAEFIEDLKRKHELAKFQMLLLSPKKELSFVFYRIPVENTKDEFGNPVDYDLNRLYIYFPKVNEWGSIKYESADLLLKTAKYFR